MPARCRRWRSEIVFGVLRYRAQLDFLIQHYSGRPAAQLDAEVRIALRMGIYQMRYLERVPAHAAVTESVELVKRARKRSAAGFANAVLRKVDREPVAWPDRATELSHPAWLLERWDRQYGLEIDRNRASGLRPPETYVRIRLGEPVPEYLEPTGIPGCYRLIRRKLPGGFRISGRRRSCRCWICEPGRPLPGLCAAPGNKTAQALESGVRAVACDLHPSRLAMLSELGIPLVVAGRHPSVALRLAVRPDPGGCALLRNRHAGPQSGDQMAADPGGSRRPAAPAGRAAGQGARAPGPGRDAGILHLFAGARRKRRGDRARCRRTW